MCTVLGPPIWGPPIKYVRSEGEGNWEIGKYCRWTILIGWVKCRQNEEGGKHPENFVNIFNGRPLAQGGCYVKWARSCHVVPKQSDWWLVTMQVALSDLPPHAHTARISRVSLIEMAHRIWVRELNGYAKIYIWHDFQQFPTSLVWEKWQKPQNVGFLTNFSKLYELFWPSRLFLTSQDISEGLIYKQKGGRIALKWKKFGFKNWCFFCQKWSYEPFWDKTTIFNLKFFSL